VALSHRHARGSTPRTSVVRAVVAALAASMSLLLASIAQGQALDWQQVLAKAKGQTVYWNAWGGDEKTNAFIAWVDDEARKRYGVRVTQVRLKDTAEAVTRVVAEKAAGRDTDGAVDLVWINGPNFLAMKRQNLLYGPFAESLPNFRYVDTTQKRSNVVDFTVPVDGYESPWRLAQLVFVYDTARMKDPPRAIPDFVAWTRAHRGRFTHPSVRNFLGVTFLKQALYELAPDPAELKKPATDETFAKTTAPLWAWYEEVKPNLWRQGRQFPENGPAQRQLLNDGELDMMISFNPSEAAVAIASSLLPDTVRTFTLAKGTIGNTSFVAIPYNAAHKEGAMVVANFLLEPATQAYAQDVRQLGSFTVLDLAKLAAEDRRRFETLARPPAMPTNAELGTTLLEPHPSWMTRIVDEWEKRYTK
jgi:putative thiamine transport system substrate-binding protein